MWLFPESFYSRLVRLEEREVDEVHMKYEQVSIPDWFD